MTRIAAGALVLVMTVVTMQAQVFETNAQKISIVTIAEGLSNPWSLAFLPNGDMLVTERTGGLRLIKGGVLQKEPIGGTPAVKYRFHAGMMDVAVHPRFAENNLIYLTYAKPKDNLTTTALMRARLDGMRLADAKDIFLADAWLPSDVNLGSRLLFDGEGMLYMTLGERNTPGAGPSPGDVGAGPQQPPGQGPAAQGRRHAGAGESVRRQARPPSGGLLGTATATRRASRFIRRPAKSGPASTVRSAATRSTSSSPAPTTAGR